MRLVVSLATALLVGNLVVTMAQTPARTRHTIDETEVLARAALAAALKAPLAEIAVAQRQEGHWPDAAFGCAPRKGVFEPTPTDGYEFTLTHAGRRYVYRSDKYGTVRRCAAAKPRGPAPAVR